MAMGLWAVRGNKNQSWIYFLKNLFFFQLHPWHKEMPRARDGTHVVAVCTIAAAMPGPQPTESLRNFHCMYFQKRSFEVLPESIYDCSMFNKKKKRNYVPGKVRNWEERDQDDILTQWFFLNWLGFSRATSLLGISRYFCIIQYLLGDFTLIKVFICS